MTHDLVEDQAHDGQLNDASDGRDDKRRANSEAEEEGEDGVEYDEAEAQGDVEVWEGREEGGGGR